MLLIEQFNAYRNFQCRDHLSLFLKSTALAECVRQPVEFVVSPTKFEELVDFIDELGVCFQFLLFFFTDYLCSSEFNLLMFP